MNSPDPEAKKPRPDRSRRDEGPPDSSAAGGAAARVKKRARSVGLLYGVFFGGFTAYVIWGEWANRTFAKSLDAVCAPVRLLYHLLFGADDAYLTWYFVLSIIYMAVLGYALGYGLCRLIGGRARPARPRA